MNIEAELTRRIGEAGAKLHTARSRNDQVALDLRLYLRDETPAIRRLLRGCRRALVDLGARNADVVIPGYTHLQRAQPVCSRITCSPTSRCSTATARGWPTPRRG